MTEEQAGPVSSPGQDQEETLSQHPIRRLAQAHLDKDILYLAWPLVWWSAVTLLWLRQPMSRILMPKATTLIFDKDGNAGSLSGQKGT